MMLRILLAACLLATPALARPRARDLGIPFEGKPGPLNAITDVQGVEVGHRSIVSGETVRTGVTVIFPRGTVGVLVQSNHGRRNRLTVAGVPVGKEFPDLLPEPGKHADGEGSIIVVVATDAPLLPMQLERLARRAALGIGRVGGAGENTSGDILLAFSTANPGVARSEAPARLTMLPNDSMDPLFWATVDATEEAIVNAMIAAETMKGAGGNTVHALPHDRLREILKKHQRLQP